MRILDADHDKALKNVIIYLQPEEAKELMNDLAELVEANDLKKHAHVNDLEYKHELTVVLYNENNLNGLNDRSRKLIEQDI